MTRRRHPRTIPKGLNSEAAVEFVLEEILTSPVLRDENDDLRKRTIIYGGREVWPDISSSAHIEELLEELRERALDEGMSIAARAISAEVDGVVATLKSWTKP